MVKRTLFILCGLALCVSVYGAGGFEVINVKEFGAKGDGKTDDTKAIQHAFDEASKTYLQPTIGHHYASPSSTVYFPKGVYLISDQITIPHVGEIRGEPYAALKQTNPDKDILVTNSAFRMIIEGLSFLGGRTQLNLSNPNLNTGKITISQCYFFYSTGVSLIAGVESTTVVIEDCEFIAGLQAMYLNRSDMVYVRDCWLGNPYAMKNKAVIENHAQQLVMENIAGVPAVNGINQRWIDNYGTNLTLRKFRFGGEEGGFTPVYNYTKPRPIGIGTSILIEDSWICNVGDIVDGVIYLKEIPNSIILRGNQITSRNLVQVSDSINLNTYFKDNGIVASMLSFHAEGNTGGALNKSLPRGLVKPAAAPGPKLAPVSGKKIKTMTSNALKDWTEKATPDLTDGEYKGHMQQADPARYLDVTPDKYRFDTADHMDATRIKNSEYYTIAQAGTDILWIWNREGNDWPHFTIRNVEVDLDKTPFLAYKIKTMGHKALEGIAVKVFVLGKGIAALVESSPPFGQTLSYKAHNLAELLDLSGTQRLDIRFYPASYGFTDPAKFGVDTTKPGVFTHAQPGQYGVFDFVRFEAE